MMVTELTRSRQQAGRERFHPDAHTDARTDGRTTGKHNAPSPIGWTEA